MRAVAAQSVTSQWKQRKRRRLPPARLAPVALHVMSCLDCLVLSLCCSLSAPFWLSPALSCPCCPALPCFALPCLALPCLALRCPALFTGRSLRDDVSCKGSGTTRIAAIQCASMDRHQWGIWFGEGLALLGADIPLRNRPPHRVPPHPRVQRSPHQRVPGRKPRSLVTEPRLGRGAPRRPIGLPRPVGRHQPL